MSDTDDRNANLIYEIKRRKEMAARCNEMADQLLQLKYVDPARQSINVAIGEFRREADRHDDMADEYVLRLLKAERLQKITEGA